MVEDLTRYTPNGKVHPQDEADVALADHKITVGDRQLVREGVLTLTRARARKAEKPKGGHPEDNALARAEISPQAYRAVLRGEMDLSTAKQKGRAHEDDTPAKIANAAAKAKGGSWATADLKKGDAVWVRGSAWANKAGAVCVTFLQPDGSPDDSRKQKIESLDWKRDGETPAPAPEVEYVEVVPDRSKIKAELTAQYRELLERDARACAEGARDGSDVSAAQVAMSELKKLSKKLRLGVDFSALDREAQQRG